MTHVLIPITSLSAGVDYEEINMTLLISAGAFKSCVNLSILEDEAVEYNETFILKLTISYSFIVIGVFMVEVTIVEDGDSKSAATTHCKK